jgi:hypothetical protein
LGEQERKNQRDTQNPPKSRSPKIHSQRDVLVWSKRRSRSPPTTPQIYARINGGVCRNQAQGVKKMGAKLEHKEEEEVTLKDKGARQFKGLGKIWPLEPECSGSTGSSSGSTGRLRYYRTRYRTWYRKTIIQIS